MVETSGWGQGGWRLLLITLMLFLLVCLFHKDLILSLQRHYHPQNRTLQSLSITSSKNLNVIARQADSGRARGTASEIPRYI